jgi:CheY-like chemotaxis protein
MERLALSGWSILVVEDDALIAIDLRQTLESAGAYVFAATQLPRALQLAGHPDISAAVLGCRLSQEDSTAICSRLEQRGIPFIFYSSYNDLPQSDAVPVPKSAEEKRLIEAVGAVLGSYARAA